MDRDLDFDLGGEIHHEQMEAFIIMDKSLSDRKCGFAQFFFSFRLTAEAQQTHNDSGSEGGSHFVHAFDGGRGVLGSDFGAMTQQFATSTPNKFSKFFGLDNLPNLWIGGELNTCRISGFGGGRELAEFLD